MVVEDVVFGLSLAMAPANEKQKKEDCCSGRHAWKQGLRLLKISVNHFLPSHSTQAPAAFAHQEQRNHNKQCDEQYRDQSS